MIQIIKRCLGVCLLFLSIALILNCNPKKIEVGSFGPECNNERLQLGIPPVEENWVPNYPIKNLVEWGPNTISFKMNKPQHLMKSIRIENDIRIYEEDTFLKYVDENLSIKLRIKYSFIDSSNHRTYLLINQNTKEVMINGIRDRILEEEEIVLSKKDALKMLSDWGFNK